MPGGEGQLNLPSVHLRGPVPFVGRAAQLAQLKALLADPPGLVVVEGEAGIGKTRLVRRALHDVGVPVLLGTCDDVPEPFLLGAVLDAVRGAADLLARPSQSQPNQSQPNQSQPSQSQPSQLVPVIGAVAPLLPELAAVLPPAPPPLADPPAERHRLFRALGALLAGLAPAVLVLEDLHWADSVTADFVAYLATRPVPGVPLVVTARIQAEAPIHEALSRIPGGSVVRIGIPPLDAADVRDLTGRALGLADPPTRLTDTLLERTAGIPFVVEEVLRSLSERGGNPLDDLTVPYLLRDVVLLRLRALDGTATEVLGAAAVLGMVPPLRTLAAVLGIPAATVSAALAEVTQAGLIHDDGSGPRFRHDLARQAVYELIPEVTRNILHRNIARVLEEARPRPVAVLAHHYRRAGSNADFVRNAEAAADQATRQGDDATAARFLLQTMDIAELPRPTRVRLAGKLGRSAIDGAQPGLRDPGPGAASRRPAATAGGSRRPRPGARPVVSPAGRGAARVHRDRASAAVHPLGRSTGPGAGRAGRTGHGGRRNIRDHLARCAEAEQAAERSNDPGARLAVRIARASLMIEIGDPTAWSVISTLRAETSLADRPREHARACLNWAQGMLHSGHLEQAETLAVAGRELVEESGYERLLALCDLTDVSLDRAAGRDEKLEPRLTRLLEQSARFPVIRLETNLELALVRAAAGTVRPASGGCGRSSWKPSASVRCGR